MNPRRKSRPVVFYRGTFGDGWAAGFSMGSIFATVMFLIFHHCK